MLWAMTSSDDQSFELHWPTDTAPDPEVDESMEPVIDDATSIWSVAEVGDGDGADVDGIDGDEPGWPAGPAGPSPSPRGSELVDEIEPHAAGADSGESLTDERPRLTMRVRLARPAEPTPRRTPRI